MPHGQRLLPAVALFAIASCSEKNEDTSNSASKIKHSSKPNYTFQVTDYDRLRAEVDRAREGKEGDDSAYDEAVEKICGKYMGKVIETRGYVREAEPAGSSAAPSPFVLVLQDKKDSEVSIVCYSQTSAKAFVGKTVLVKGIFEYPGAPGLRDCVISE